MVDIKVKKKDNTVIKKLDRTAIMSSKIKQNIVDVKDKTKETYEKNENSGQEYAQNKIQNSISNATYYGIGKANQIGKKSEKRTVENIKNIKKNIQRGKQKLKTAKESIKKVKQAGERTAKTIKNSIKTAKQSVKTARKTIKTAEKTTNTAIKTTKQVAKATVKVAQKTVQVAKTTAKTTVKAVQLTVKATIAGDVTIPYEVSARKLTIDTADDIVQLPDKDIRLYLEKDAAGGTAYTQVAAPKAFSANGTGEEGVGTPTTNMVLDSGSFTATQVVKYRLRMWVDQAYQVTAKKAQYKVAVDVYGKAS